MKKLSLLAVAVFGAAVLSAGTPPGPSPERRPMDEWTPIQIGFTYRLPSATYNSNVYGFKFGLPICGGVGRVCGNEIALFAAATQYVYGFQTALFYTEGHILQGFQASLGCNIAKSGHVGFQATCGYNYSDKFAGMQAGVVNTSADFAGIQAAAVNVSDNAAGIQAGVCVNIADKLGGAQFGLYNQAQEADGLQAGLVNVSMKSGFQIGLVNYIKDGWIPVFPLINFKF